jgi:hypothetical protein
MEPLSDSEQKIVENILKIMTTKNPTDKESLNYLINNAQPMVDILKRSMINRLISFRVPEEEATAMLEVLIEMASIAGGINFADFSTTDKLFSSIEESNE